MFLGRIFAVEEIDSVGRRNVRTSAQLHIVPLVGLVRCVVFALSDDLAVCGLRIFNHSGWN